jgi:hypothetical protein
MATKTTTISTALHSTTKRPSIDGRFHLHLYEIIIYSRMTQLVWEHSVMSETVTVALIAILGTLLGAMLSSLLVRRRS